MGNNQISTPQPSLFDVTFDMRQKSKNLERQADRMEKQINAEKLKVKNAIQKGDMEVAKIYAQNAIRKKAERVNMYRLSARIDACANQVETAGRTQNISKMMGKVVQGLDLTFERMDVDQITQVMDKFETQIEDLEVISEYQSSALQTSSAHLEKPEEVDSLLQEVATEHNLEFKNQMVDIGGTAPIGQKVNVSQQQQQQNDQQLLADIDLM